MRNGTVARIGGDEFIVLLENITDKDVALKIAKVIVEKMSEPCSIDGEEFRLSCSVGIANYPEHGTTTDELLMQADKGMYKAKRKEGGTYYF